MSAARSRPAPASVPRRQARGALGQSRALPVLNPSLGRDHMSEVSTRMQGAETREEARSSDATPVLERLLFSAAEVAEALGISSTTVRQLSHQGDLPCVAIGKRMLYRRQDVERFVDSLVNE